jgi:hypothetical protein
MVERDPGSGEGGAGRQRVPAAPGPAGEGDGHPEADAVRRLEEEHDRDEAALAEALGEDARLHDSEGAGRPRPASSPWLGLPRRTRVLVLGVAGGLVLLAGIQVGKLTGGGERWPEPPGPGRADRAAPRSAAADSGLTRGEIVAIAGSTLYVRDPDGRTVALRTTPPPRVARAQPVAPGDLRPGDAIVAESSRAADGRLTARSITVLPPPDRRRGR